MTDNILLALLMTACVWLIWLDWRGISPRAFLRRWLLVRRVHKNLGVSWKAARRIVNGGF
jgi:hypothetical protein